ncbi:MAG TPA: hypothetical protein ENN19_12700 [Chloroflexi bacterium]|nr:hypothetical protein [Chloroflexota bacterium]
MSDDGAILRRQLADVRENLALVLERKAEYVCQTDVPLQLVKEERYLRRQIRELERQIEQAKPIDLLRRATKLLTEPVAWELDGMPWKTLKQRLLTQASKLPAARYLDVAALERAADELARLNRETALLLEACRIQPNPGQLEAVEQRAVLIVQHLLVIYRLSPGEAWEFERLMGKKPGSNSSQENEDERTQSYC